MDVNFNRSIKFLLVLIFLIATGCSTTSKDSFNDRPPASSETDNSYVRHALHPFGKQKYTVSTKYKNTVWERLISLYSLPEIENERINRELNWYLRHPGYLARVQQRAEPYLHLILDEIEAKNIPGELALLPIVESAFLPEAYSKSDASGLWQFIPATGRLYGLQQNEWYDGRRDVYTSTKAATSFLKHLGETFDGDWHLALASYNYGKGNVRKAIEKNENLNLPTDYWSLDLPKETADYVPRLLAVARIFANADKYNIDLQYIPNKPYCELVDAKSQLDLNKAAELANTPLNEFLKLNPGFNHSSTAPQGPHHLLIPVDKAQTFKENLAQLPYDERVDFKRYQAEIMEHMRHDEIQTARANQHKVKAGESLASIAEKNNTTPQSIRQANHLTSNSIHSGMLLKMPAAAQKSPDVQLTAKVANKPGNAQVYVVKQGDTFWNVAQKFSVSVNDIRTWNKIPAQAALVLGQKLTIKAANQQAAASSTTGIRSISYTVKQGDSLAQISRKFNVSIADLRKWNSPAVSNSLTPGKKLKVILNT
ncbi:lytic transglycosylase [Candidatus Methylobacter oryzae]|uniref:LysM peptidoglycan-binding domain-containing protein n=1 Tax=Candidatus Methylobacter oryzae TaxID=2497749 RepID=A0ABY3C9N3_9GAMM|nr:LysM peptidoglycan-binding domain-containing protein [Candidatus Methylobacter oryzae]TRW94355.1 LysM peptidoglycan-binding domain-containing protein [Candidatus Methylobacter oryzae]